MECVESVRVHPDNVTLRVGQWYYGAWAEVSPASANCSEVEWHSDNPDIASVNTSNGYIYGVSAGTTKIYAIAMDKNHCGDYITVTVVNNVPVTSVVLSRAEISIEEGDSFTLTATAFPENATNKALNWGSTNTSVATVCDGIVTAKSSGYAYIYAESAADSSIKSSCYVHVTDEVLVSSVTLNMSAMNMRVGESTFLEARVCPENAADRSLLWVSSNPEIATVISNSGLIFAHSPGQTTITAVPQDGSAAFDQCSLTVLPPIHVTGIGLEQTSLTMNVGDTATLDATVCPDDARDKSVTWCSSNENVASVHHYTGEITAHLAGTATITATTVDGGYSKSCVVQVNQVLTGADLYIDDEEIKNLILQYKTINDCIQNAYLSGTINAYQRNEERASIEQALNLARSDYIILNPQSNFVYQFFRGRNRTEDDLSPFVRESYTYPNEGYTSDKDVLAITIIQRTLELLTYFEPPNEYVYGIYDQETHNALLSSPYYILGSNDFQKYSYYDMLGPTTANERTKANVEMLHKMRLFHNEVAAWVALKVAPDSRTSNTTIYKNAEHTKWGFADVMKTTKTNEYIWEVKPWDQRYRSLNGMASLQLAGYINAWNNSSIEQKYSPRLPALPGYNIGKFSFKSPLTGKTIVVQSNPAVAPDVRSGLVHYHPTKDDEEYQREFAAEYVLENQAVPVAAPTFSYDFDRPIFFDNFQINGLAEIAGVVVMVVVIGVAIYFYPPSLLYAVLCCA